MTEKDHEELCDLLLSCIGKFILSGYYHPYYHRYNAAGWFTSYYVVNKNSKPKREIFWTNFPAKGFKRPKTIKIFDFTTPIEGWGHPKLPELPHKLKPKLPELPIELPHKLPELPAQPRKENKMFLREAIVRIVREELQKLLMEELGLSEPTPKKKRTVSQETKEKLSAKKIEYWTEKKGKKAA